MQARLWFTKREGNTVMYSYFPLGPKLRSTYEKETTWFFAYRTFDRRGNHLDHRSHRDSELAAFQDGGQRSVCCRNDAHAEYVRSRLLDDLRSLSHQSDRFGTGIHAQLHGSRLD